MKKTLRWGILGLGNIAHKFAADLSLADHCELMAVASRTKQKALAFSTKHQVDVAYGSYEELFADPAIDIIYIATPHNSHKTWSIKAMQAGKHILCEKPAGVNSQEVQEMIQVAKKHNVFFMEALWTRFNPIIINVLHKIRSGSIGEVKSIQADFQFKADFTDESRLFKPALAGGATLDIGIYPLFLSYLILGTPKSITAQSISHSTGVDLQTSVICQYEKSFASLYFGLNSDSEMIATIHGEKGLIKIHGRWHEANTFSMFIDGNEQVYKIDKKGRGYSYEAEACFQAISNGKVQHKMWKHQDSLNLITICDIVRDRIGLVYPFE